MPSNALIIGSAGGVLMAKRDGAYDYAVIVALDEEASYFLELVTCSEPTDFHGFAARTITAPAWKSRGRGMLLCSAEMGKDAAARAARAAVEKAGVKTLYNLGIAGRVDPDLAIGDVIVPAVISDYSIAGKMVGTPGQRVNFLPSPRHLEVPGSLANFARIHLTTQSAASQAIDKRLRTLFPGSPFLRSAGIRVLSVPHACVPFVFAAADLGEDLRRGNRHLASLDMETAGIVGAAIDAKVDALCIRAISDGADHLKTELEVLHKDENRRFAMAAATTVLDSIMGLQREDSGYKDPDEVADPTGDFDFVLSTDDAVPNEFYADFARHERLFSLLVIEAKGEGDAKGEPLGDPIQSFIDEMTVRDHYRPVLLIGEKGVGKTTLFKYLHRGLVSKKLRGDSAPDFPETAFFLRMSQYENWGETSLDEHASTKDLENACDTILEVAERSKGNTYVLLDGLNQTGEHRIQMIATAVRKLRRANIRLALTAERAEDIQLLDRQIETDIRVKAKLRPVAIEDPILPDLVSRFSDVVGERHDQNVIQNMKDKGVAFVDTFILAQFFGRFQQFAYSEFKYLSECYNQLCMSELSENQSLSADEKRKRMAQVAHAAFDILISGSQRYADIKHRDTAKLISNHSSVTDFLVAKHIIDTITLTGSNKELTTARTSARLNYVFPASINNFTKQIMLSTKKIEDSLIGFIRSNFYKLGVLARSHSAYLAGRVSEARADEMRAFLQRASAGLKTPKKGQNGQDLRMLRRSIYISRAMLGDSDAERKYAEILLEDVEEADFNRGFHLEYYGDVPFNPSGKMSRRDNGSMPCDRTFSRLLDRIQQRSGRTSVIELVTLLSLLQVRLLQANVRAQHREIALDLLHDRDSLGNLGDRLVGYVGRMQEDLASEKFDLATVIDDWLALTTTERTGWLSRRRKATEVQGAFWAERRIESVAEHVFSAVSLAMIFLRGSAKGEARPEGSYDKLRVIEMLLVHDLAEGRLGDKLPRHADAAAEQRELWKLGAFGTYPGLQYMLTIPETFQEFTAGMTPNAQVAQDLDKLQFWLQARVYRDGMTVQQQAECDAVPGRLITDVIRQIALTLINYPVTRRFTQPAPQFD